MRKHLVRRLCMYYRAGSLLEALPANREFRLEEIRSLLSQLEAAGVRLELVETGPMSDEELMGAYLEASTPAVYRKYRVRQIFGSKRYPGSLFGKGVPALVVFDDESRRPTDIYPHEEAGRVVTIREFLERSLRRGPAGQTALQAAARMDERRVRVGPVGIGTADLVRAGRRR